MSLTMFSDLLAELAPRLAEVPLLYGSDPQAVAEELAASAWGLKAVASEPNLIDVAMLGLLGRHQLVVHQLHGAASRHAAVTDLHSLPDTAPALLRHPWLVEVLHPDEGARLFGDTLSLSGYTLDGTMYLLGLLGDGRSVLASWRPRWTGEDLEEGPRRERSPVIDEGHAPPHAAWAREAARSVVIFGLLLEAEGSPLRIEEARRCDAHEDMPARTVYLRGSVPVPLVSPETGIAWRGMVERHATRAGTSNACATGPGCPSPAGSTSRSAPRGDGYGWRHRGVPACCTCAFAPSGRTAERAAYLARGALPSAASPYEEELRTLRPLHQGRRRLGRHAELTTPSRAPRSLALTHCLKWP
ncbi:hypothetical protein HJC22_23155 [Corallococcus exiguus]|uniref:hypothetical protein n=1 Tax=Corallococcus exiguus TaxID=83462 RepID=UPI001471DFAC|nr:hypothetical protein [Corallococcus exiguus]NNC18615.1 hypothetical protein [Corallococcus exiguus]